MLSKANLVLNNPKRLGDKQMDMKQPNASQGGMDDGLDEIIKMGGDEKNPFSSMVAGVSTALSKMEELLPQEGVSDDMVQKIASLRESYQALLQEIMQSVSGKGGAEEPQQMDAIAGARGVPMQ